MMIESLQNRIKELENELQTFRQIGESTQQVWTETYLDGIIKFKSIDYNIYLQLFMWNIVFAGKMKH